MVVLDIGHLRDKRALLQVRGTHLTKIIYDCQKIAIHCSCESSLVKLVKSTCRINKKRRSKGTIVKGLEKSKTMSSVAIPITR